MAMSNKQEFIANVLINTTIGGHDLNTAMDIATDVSDYDSDLTGPTQTELSHVFYVAGMVATDRDTRNVALVNRMTDNMFALMEKSESRSTEENIANDIVKLVEYAQEIPEIAVHTLERMSKYMSNADLVKKTAKGALQQMADTAEGVSYATQDPEIKNRADNTLAAYSKHVLKKN